MAEIGFVPMAAGGAVKCGVFTGDGQASRFISLGVTPKWVAVWTKYGAQFDQGIALFGGIALQDNPCSLGAGGIIKIAANGFTVYCDANLKIESNDANISFYYLYGI